MWIKTVLVLVIIKLSEEKCEKTKKVATSFSIFHVNSGLYSYLSCTGITPNDDLYSDIFPLIDSSIESIVISESNIPELSEDTFHNVTVAEVKIEANIEIVQSKAFENANISSITLDHNDIRKIKDMSFSSSAIQFLSLRNNSLSEIKVKNFYGLSNLTKLYLQYNNISDIEEDSFITLTSLDELNLSFNKLVELRFGLFKSLERLETIYLNNNLLKGLSNNMFSQCPSLKYLSIENNYITIFDARHFSKSLLAVNASRNQLLSVQLSNLLNMDTIDISYNKLTSIQGCVSNMPSLKFLYASYNSLGPSTDVTTLQDLKNLNTIDLDGNGLQMANLRLFENLPLLTGVSLAENNITDLDLSDYNSHLTTLTLSKNYLNRINLSKLQDLWKLDLSYNSLQEIGYEAFENMTSLTHLYLQYNSIHSLHMGCFRDLKQLRILNLSHNKITVVETGAFTGLKELVSLDISYNNLSHLDENVFHSTRRLSNLNIAYNNLINVEIKKIMLHSSWFRELNLIGNNWTCKILAEFARRNAYLLLTHGTFYNVTNVYGIPCNNTEDEPSNTLESAMNTSVIQDHLKAISYKMTVNIVILIILLILLCVKFGTFTCCTCYTTARQFVYKRYRNEQELQLV